MIFNGFIDFFKGIDWTNIAALITTISTFLSIILTVLIIVLKLSGNKKASKVADRLTQFNTFVKSAAVEAEQFSHFSPVEKKAYALTKVKSACMEAGLVFTDDEISFAIENLIDVSKKINYKK